MNAKGGKLTDSCLFAKMNNDNEEFMKNYVQK